jgi:hypothetical protein
MNAKSFLIISFLGIALTATAQYKQSIVGTYESTFETGVDNLADVEITKDPKYNKRIWISGITAQGKIYAIMKFTDDESAMYTIPAQKVGSKTIKQGNLIYDYATTELFIDNNPIFQSSSILTGKNGVTIKDGNGANVVSTGEDGDVYVNDGNGRSVKTDKDGGVQIHNKPTNNVINYTGYKKGFKPNVSLIEND